MKKALSIIFLLIAAACLILGIVSISAGFDKKDHYYNSDTYYSHNVNAYVGGDAYNYIINAGYFSGYMALGGSLLVVSSVLAVAGTTLIVLDSKNKNATQLPAIREQDPGKTDYSQLPLIKD